MNQMEDVQQQEQQEQRRQQQQQQRNQYGDVLGQARRALEDIRTMPRGGREPEKWLAPETVSLKALKQMKNTVLGASSTTSRRVDACLLAISLLADGVRVEQQTRFKYEYLKSLRSELNNHEDEVLESRKEVREAKRARRETAANRPSEVKLHADDVGELSNDDEDLR